VGINPAAAQYAGMQVAVPGVHHGAVRHAGRLAGAVKSWPAPHPPRHLSTGYGFDAIAIALLARSRPLGVLPAALLWGDCAMVPD
jgi:simple sugar transport system permease protein